MKRQVRPTNSSARELFSWPGAGSWPVFFGLWIEDILSDLSDLKWKWQVFPGWRPPRLGYLKPSAW